MNALPRPLPFDAGSLGSPSERLLRSHHENNHGGAVKRLNALRSTLRQRPAAELSSFELNSLKREELIATHSMLRHEL